MVKRHLIETKFLVASMWHWQNFNKLASMINKEIIIFGTKLSKDLLNVRKIFLNYQEVMQSYEKHRILTFRTSYPKYWEYVSLI